MRHYARNQSALAVSSRLTFTWQSNSLLFHQRKKTKGNGLWWFTCSSLLISHYSSMLAIRDVQSHPETTMKHISSHISITPTTPTTMGTIHMGQTADKMTAESRQLHVCYIDTYSIELFPSAELRISFLANQAKKNKHVKRAYRIWCESGGTLSTYCRFHTFF